MSVLGDKTGRANIRHVILTFIILSGLAAAFLYYPPIPTRTAEELTRGDITFTDISGNPISGAIGISGSGISGGYKENVNFIKWERIPNGIIYFDALGIKNVSVKFRLGGDSQNANVVIENYGAKLPKALDEPAPGTPVKYLQVSALNLSFVEAEISIKYNASELGNIDENSLKIYHYDRTAKAWSSLKTKIDAKDDILTAAVDSLSIFAVSARLPGQIDIRDAGSTHIRSDIRTYDNARDLKKSVRSSSLVAQDIPPGGELEVDAITSKNVALRLKVNAATGGEIILDDYGRKNPVSVPLPGRPVKFVEIGVQGISFSSAEVSVRYKEAELNGVSENSLVIYHWNLTYWEALDTTIDAVNNILTASTNALSPFAISGSLGGPDRILVATNRYVILDDPVDSAGGANASAGYALPFAGEWGNKNTWKGNQTTIGVSTLFIDNNGKALSGRTVNFTIYDPNSSIAASGSNVTDPSGLAHFYKDMDNVSFYGVWKVKAESGGVSSNTTFIYNWWGCAWATTGQCGGQHSGRSPADMGQAAANSPYTMSWERTTSANTTHNLDMSLNGWTDDYCTVCHQSYDGNPTTSNVEGSTAKDFYVNDVHSNISCTDAACHDPNGTSGWNDHNTGSITIGSCDNCHDRTDISKKSTLDGAVSSYSNSSGTYDKYHTPNATVPCIICHGPMHNISKPDPAAVSQNNVTEDTQCAGCHTGFSLHNNSVNCTFCHSSDAHFITVFGGATYVYAFGGATYVYTNSPEKGDCTNCHQNSTFMDAMKNVPKAGNYSGRNAPQVPVSVVHSEDSINGSKWNITEPYWTNTSQIERCKYCHGETMHKMSALGRSSLFSGGNPVNGTISTSLTWCQQCHWQGSQDYAIMAATFIEDNRTVPPEITGNSTFGIVTASDGTIYVNHSSYAKDDAKCWSCHGALSGNDSVTGIMHSAAEGNAGGANCTSCHNTGGTANNVNFSAIELGMHAFLNSGAVSSPENASNRPCWACHGTKIGTWANESDQPVGEHNTSVFNNPRKCENCHNDTSALFGAGNVTDHIPSSISPSTDVNTSYYRYTYCSYCHNNSIIEGNDVSMGVSGGSPVNASVSHYGANRTGGRLMSPSSNSTDCVYCHRNSSNMLKWGITQGSRANISNKNGSDGGTDHSTFTSSLSCPACHGNYVITGGFTFHDSALGSGTISASAGNSDCVSCHDIGGTATSEINVTSMKQGNHQSLNRNATNATPLDPINKACWACHGYGTDPGGHSDNNSKLGDYRNPWTCVDCHSRYPNFTSSNLTIRNEITGRKVIDHIQKSHAESIYSDAYNPAVNCTTCHDKSKVNFTDSVTPTNPAGANVSHYSDYSSLISPTTNCSLCHQSTANAVQWDANLTRHPAKDQNYTFCANCHNSTNIVTFHSQPLVWTPTIHGFQGNRAFDWEKDDATGGVGGSLAESDESCAACHSGVLDRTCENCHMPNTTSMFTGPFNPGGVIRDDINDTLPYVYAHINYSTLTGTGVDVPNQNNPGYPTSCYNYNTGTNAGTCHGNSYFNSTPAGGYYAFRGSSSLRNLSDPAHRTKTIDRLPETTNCLFCHAQASATIRYAWGSAFQVNASNMFGNRYSVSSNESCYLCHTRDSTKPADFHSLTVVSGGGPGCLGCHNTSSPQNYSGMHYIDGGNFSISSHANLNSNNASGYGVNASCWACHNSTGTVVPDNTHPDRKTNPFVCTDCHLANGNMAGAYNASIVSNHFRNGTAINALANRTSDLVSCIECHENVSGMLLPNNDNETGSFAGDMISVTGGRNSTYHYGEAQLNFGKTKGSEDYCTYCHRNVTGEFKGTFTSSSNSSISNHSASYNASNPSCSLGQCHNSAGATLHGNGLIRPSTGYDSLYCLKCHGKNTTTGVANYSGITTGTKERHNNSINCEECHMNDGKDIHPVKYLTRSGWNTSSTNAINCTDCHQGSGFTNALVIMSPLAHSDSVYSGSLWGSYWQNTTQLSSCNYCHTNSSLHNASGLGKASQIQYTNAKNQSLTDNGHWCANCHYNSIAYTNATYRYGGTAYSPVPPNISEQKTVIASDGTSWFNHTLESYSDTKCKECHGGIITLPYSSRFVHEVSKGQGGSNCILCHDINIAGEPLDKKINVTAMRLGNHGHLNQNATNSTPTDPINKACWACHGYGTDPGGHSDNNSNPGDYRNPWTCVDCHTRYPNFTSSNLTLVTEITGRKVIDHIQTSHAESIYSDAYNPAVNCTTCHDKSKVNFTDSMTPTNPVAANVSHYSDYSSLLVPSTNCSLCHQSPANAAQWYANLTRHPAKNQSYTFCANCHNSTNIVTFHSQPLIWTPTIHGFQGNPGFDWEKDDATGGIGGSLAESDESCAACHSGSLKRTCENCHMPNTTSLFTGPYNPGNVMRKDINDTLPFVYAHINYSSMTGTGVDVPSQNNPNLQTSCYYYNNGTDAGTCHGNSYYNRTPAGGYYAFKGLSTVKDVTDPAHRTKTIDRLPDTTDCLFCHAQASATIRYAWGSAFQVNASNMFGDRYSISSNESCYLCHTRDSSKPADFHSFEVVSGGGPGCLGCHNTSTPQNYSGMHYIDGGNFSRSVHANMNVNNASGYGVNASCWACHNSTGTVVPDNTHPDRKTTPFTCTDCHLENGSRAGAYNATIIFNHFKNGTAIRAQANRTSDIASCIECHENVSGMLVLNNDIDNGSFDGDMVNQNGGNTSAYHYSANRMSFGKTEGSDDYCIYCHRNATGEFNLTFMYPSNRSISNHSERYNASTPSCSLGQCHNSTGRTLHGNNLSKPDTGYNSSYCLSCHGENTSNGTTNFSGITTRTKSKHNNSINCEECHMNDGRDIHPVKYLQPEGIFNTSNSTAVNCVLCHLTGMAGFSNAPMIPAMHHSDNNNTGSIWNLTSAYWTNTSPQSMCDYCHGDSRHDENGLGRPANWSGLNVINSSITNNSNWCAGCHYQGYSSGSVNYNNMVQKFEEDNLSVPPEITNHSSYAPYSKNGYFNHTLTPDYTDSTCKGCHGPFLSNGTRMDGFMHNISTGSGTCTGCHFSYSYMSNTGVAERYVNQSMYNSSAHGSLDCEDCHTKGHQNIAARKACEDCHSYQQDPINDRDRHNITGTPAQNVVNNTDCTSCHNSGLLTNATSQYGNEKTYDCNYCHTYPDNTYS